ncbi:MAG: hypothetical protein AAF670_05405 [Planctomycetota bacterium]
MKIDLFIVLAALGILVGCSGSPTETASSPSASSGKRLLLASEPDGAIPVGEARQTVQSDQEVTLVGLVGGSTEPFVDGIAAFTIVDESVPYCSPDEGCPTPWDYCCKQNQVQDNIATIKIVDEAGSPIASNARDLIGVEGLSKVVVQGRATRDDAGNLSVAATKIFIRPGE